MCAPVAVTSLRGRSSWLLHVGGVGRVQDVRPRALVLPVDHLPAPGQQHDHVGLTAFMASSHWYGHGCWPRSAPG